MNLSSLNADKLLAQQFVPSSNCFGLLRIREFKEPLSPIEQTILSVYVASLLRSSKPYLMNGDPPSIGLSLTTGQEWLLQIALSSISLRRLTTQI